MSADTAIMAARCTWMPESSLLFPLPTACGARVRMALLSPYCTAKPVTFQYEFAMANASSCSPSSPAESCKHGAY